MTTKQTFDRRTFLRTTGGLTAAGLVAGCLGGGGDGGGGDGSDGGDTGGTTPSDGDTGGQQTTPSLEARAKEAGTIKIAQSMSGWNAFIKDWEGQSGIDIGLFRTDSAKIATRLLSEHNADQMTFDIGGFGNTVNVFVQLAKQGVFQEFVPNHIEENAPSRSFMHNLGQELYTQESLVLLINENDVSNPPTTISEWLNWEGTYALDVRDSEILAGLRYANGEQKGTELAKKLANGATWRDSHFTSAQQVARGEIDAALTYSKYRGYEWGGPLKKTPVEGFPTVGGTACYGMTNGASHVDAAHYWMNYAHANITQWLNENVMDVFLQPEDVPEDWFVWNYDFVKDTDLKQLEEEWRQAAGLTN